jgi:hypothetical protein
MSKKYKGRILEITSEKTFTKDGKNYSYRVVVLEVDDYILATNYWLKEELPPEGANVTFTIKVSSERNHKHPEQFFHKVKLLTIYESTRIPTEVLN